MTQYSAVTLTDIVQSYPIINPIPLLMPDTKLGRDKYKFYKSWGWTNPCKSVDGAVTQVRPWKWHSAIVTHGLKSLL